MIEKVHSGMVYTVEHLDRYGNTKSVEQAFNIIPNVGLDYILGSSFKGVSQYSSWYLGAYTAARTPVATDTMTTLMADCSEDTVYTVVAGARQTIAFPAVDTGVLTTVDYPNTLVFPGASTIRGLFVTSNVTRGSNAGLLVSAVLLPSPKVMAALESLKVVVGFALVSA